MARAATRGRGSAADSVFRRRWSWRTRVFVGAAGLAIAVALRLLYLTLRIRLTDVDDVFARRRRGEAVLAAFWHESICLMPLLVARLGWPGRVNALLSWHNDAEIAGQAMRRLGIHSVRGSSRRGWVGGIRGLLAARARGEDLVIVPDGPRGPRRQAKEGVVQLAQATGLPLLVIGAAARPVRRLGSWDRMQLPAPFARVGLVLRLVVLPEGKAAALPALEAALVAANTEAAGLVGADPT